MAWIFDTQPSSETTLGLLPRTAQLVNAGDAGRVVQNIFEHDASVPGVLVIKDAGLLGMVSRGKYLEVMGRPFGREVFLGRSIMGMMDDLMRQPLLLEEHDKIHDAARMALERAPADRYEPVVVHLAGTRPDDAGTWGIVDVALLLQAQSQILTGQIASLKQAEAERERLQQQLLSASRQAGMAEVATGVLHNVGNVLNGVTVSTNLITERLKQSKVVNLGKAAAMMQEHKEGLSDFLTSDERGKALPGYLLKLSGFLSQEQQMLVEEVDGLARSVEHIREIVSAQQSYAKVSTVKQRIDLAELLDEAVRINSVTLERHRVEVIREYIPLPPLLADKHQIMQILVNLVSNAKNALRDSALDDRRMTLRVGQVEMDGHKIARLSVTDNGVGVPEENLMRLFQHGFTTRMDGHGFGLHNAANTAHQMGGSLTAASDGPGCGASFTLELPYEISEAALSC